MPSLRLVVETPRSASTEDTSRHEALVAWFRDPTPLKSLDRTGQAALLRDLSFAVADIVAGRRRRAVVPTEASAPKSVHRARKGAVWEIGLERDEDRLLVSLFRQGSEPEVAQCDHDVKLEVARQDLLDTIARFSATDRGLALARETLLAVTPRALPRGRHSRETVTVGSTGRVPLVISAKLAIRKTSAPESSEVARADLHALLFRGELSVELGSSRRSLKNQYVFLVAEQLVKLGAAAIDAFLSRQGMLRRVEIAGTMVGLSLDEGGRATLLLGHAGKDSGWRMPPVDGTDFARAVVSFGRRLAKQILATDRGQRDNLRLTAFRRELRELVERLRGSAEQVSSLNRLPESYRAFAESDTARPASVATQARSLGKLRFSESWRADVPGLDLKSIFVVGDRLLVGASRELACIERTSGHLLWSRPSHRAVSIMTPVGVARLSADGRLALHDTSDGERLFEVSLAPCVGASASGAVVSAPGLPHMLLIGEGARHLCAVDLDSSEIRWRRVVRSRADAAARRPLRLRRAGKLMLVSGGEAQLLAVDILTGEVVWRHAGRYRYSQVAVEGDRVFAFASEVAGRKSRAVLECLDPWTGRVFWRATLPRPIALLGAPRVTERTVVLTTRDDDRDGPRTGAMAFDAETGALRYDMPGGLCEGLGGCLVVDGVLLANSESGELVAVDADTGATRYRHVFAGWSSRFHPADRPRSVQPVLRSGALFLPQSEVYVVRPSDGALLGRLPADLIPDTLRVDERCGVYIAEASGYLAAYHALPTLTVVQR
ncbi:MAG: PQQ-binding-like beta-propeller repeat protein [Polyangiaceae bacterium]